MRLALSRVGDEVLFRKYKAEGLNSDQAGKRLKDIKKGLRILVGKLREQGKSTETINEKFKTEFEKLCQQVDYTGTKRKKRRIPKRRKA